MILKNVYEFRGSATKTNDNGIYYYVNLEQDDGESCKFSCSDKIDLSQFKKGDRVNTIVEYSNIYKSLKVVSLEKVK